LLRLLVAGMSKSAARHRVARQCGDRPAKLGGAHLLYRPFRENGKTRRERARGDGRGHQREDGNGGSSRQHD
jgi:hypothetical protein